MAGCGGGSTYTALLAISGLPFFAIPAISLLCNLLVSGQGSAALIKKGYADWSILLPLLIGSVPSAFLSGMWRLPESTFLVILASALLVAGISMLLQSFSKKSEHRPENTSPKVLLLSSGIGLGLLAGLTGIGGGIYLAPVMHLFGWARAHTIATCTSLFIVFNSIAGLAGQLTKGPALLDSVPIHILGGLVLSVLIGGKIGSFLLTNRLPQKYVRSVTAFVILIVAIRLWLRVLYN